MRPLDIGGRSHQSFADGPDVVAVLLQEVRVALGELDPLPHRRSHKSAMCADVQPGGSYGHDVVATIEREGIEKFVASFNSLLSGITKKQNELAAAAYPPPRPRR